MSNCTQTSPCQQAGCSQCEAVTITTDDPTTVVVCQSDPVIVVQVQGAPGPVGPPGPVNTDCTCTFADVAPCESPQEGDIVQFTGGEWTCTAIPAPVPDCGIDPAVGFAIRGDCENEYNATQRIEILPVSSAAETNLELATNYHNTRDLIELTRGNADTTLTTTTVDVAHVVTAGPSFTIKQTGDTLGDTDLTIRNVAGQNGASITTTGFEVADLILKTPSSTVYVRNENRGSGTTHTGAAEEIELGPVGNKLTDNPHPWLCVTNGITQVQGDTVDLNTFVRFANNTSDSGKDYVQAEVQGSWDNDLVNTRAGKICLNVYDNLGAGHSVLCGTVDGVTINGTITGDGSGLTNLPSSGLPSDATFDTLTVTTGITSEGTDSFNVINAAQIAATTLAGSGASITGLDAGNVSTGTLAISHGGTGQTTANAALNALLPSQTSNSGKVLTTSGTNTSWTAAGSGGIGTVTSVDMTVPSGFAVSGNPVTTSGTLAVSYATGQTANSVLATPDGTTGALSVRALVANDIPNLDAGKVTTGTLPINRGGTGQTTAPNAVNALLPTQTSNSGKFLTTDGSVSSWGSGNSGTVTSVAASVPSGFSVSGAVTTSGTLAITYATGQTANLFLATPDGSTGALSLRSLAAGDIPNISAAKLTSGTLDNARLSGVALTASANTFTVGGQAITIATASDVGLTIKGASSQSGDLFRLRDNTPTTLVNFDSSGYGFCQTAVFPLAVGATASTGTNKAPSLVVPRAGKIVKAFAYSRTGPTGADFICDINLNGTSVWNGTQSNRIKITAGSTTGTQTSFDTTAVSEGDRLDIDIDQIGSTVAGQDITIQLLILTKNN